MNRKYKVNPNFQVFLTKEVMNFRDKVVPPPSAVAATHSISLTQEISKCNKILNHCKAGFLKRRFIGYLIRKSKGKVSKIYSTKKGNQLKKPIDVAWKSLYQRYSWILGIKEGDRLTQLMDDAAQKLEGKQ